MAQKRALEGICCLFSFSLGLLDTAHIVMLVVLSSHIYIQGCHGHEKISGK